jgi:nitroreductase
MGGSKMNEVIKAILERYSCRDFSAAPLSCQQVDTLVKAALASPSAVNRQPWHIIAITDKNLLDEMDSYALEGIKAQSEEFYKRMMDRGGKIFYNAPCLIVIAKDGSDYAALDCGIVSQNIALAAHSMGLGSVICGMARSTLEGAKGEEFKKRIKIPEGYVFGMSVCVGTALSGKEPHELDMLKVTYIK